MNQPPREPITIGSQIVIAKGQPIVINLNLAGREIDTPPAVLLRLSQQLETVARIGQFLERYRLMLIARGEPEADQHCQDLLKYMGSLADDNTQATRQPIRSTRFNRLQEVPNNEASD
jgi:hypothetical protein